jgi:hypothetical protein
MDFQPHLESRLAAKSDSNSLHALKSRVSYWGCCTAWYSLSGAYTDRNFSTVLNLLCEMCSNRLQFHIESAEIRAFLFTAFPAGSISWITVWSEFGVNKSCSIWSWVYLCFLFTPYLGRCLIFSTLGAVSQEFCNLKSSKSCWVLNSSQ